MFPFLFSLIRLASIPVSVATSEIFPLSMSCITNFILLNYLNIILIAENNKINAQLHNELLGWLLKPTDDNLNRIVETSPVLMRNRVIFQPLSTLGDVIHLSHVQMQCDNTESRDRLLLLFPGLLVILSVSPRLSGYTYQVSEKLCRQWRHLVD